MTTAPAATINTTMKGITPDTLIGEVIEQYPEVIETLLSYGVHCLGCHVSPYESIGDGFRGHGMEEAEIQEAITKLNEVIQKSGSRNQEKVGEKDEEMIRETATIIVTDNAAAKIKEALTQNNKKALRISVKPGGCSGFTYALDVDDQAHADDLILVDKGVQLFINQASLSKLNGATVDYVESLQASGFKISNPQFQHNCGCGKSFR
ncbi:MAG: iron-sulfur cluster assembly accessory protein [Nanoarchaeota archaeon]